LNIYLILEISADGKIQFWACTINRCGGRAHSAIGTLPTAHLKPNDPLKGHNHQPNPSSQVVRERKGQIKQTAKQNPALAPRDIFTQAVAGLGDEARIGKLWHTRNIR
jgi:hypothetical protein